MSGARRPTNKWLTTVSITFGTLMGAIDASIVNVALYHIRGTVGASTEEIAWISTGFIIANVMVMPLTAFLGRLFGQKRVYMACLALFIVGSVLCGTATTLWTLVAWRFVQGLGAGALQPTEQAILRQTFPPHEQGMAMALFGMAVMIGPAVGPSLGGYIVDNYAWQWIFYINVPVGLLGLFMVWRFVHEPDDIRDANRAAAAQQRRHMDWAGIALMCVGLAALQFVIEEGSGRDWFESDLIVVLTFVAGIALAAFVVRELTAKVPAVDLRLFKDRTFAAGTIIGAVMFAMLIGSMLLLPLFMQELLGFDATDSGLLLMPRTLAMMIAVPIVGRLYNKVSPQLTIAFGVFCFVAGAWGLSHLTLDSAQRDLLVPLIVTGIGFACLFVPLTTAALASIPRMQLADATGMNSLMRQIGGSFGIAVFATSLSTFTREAHGSIASHVSWLSPEAAARFEALKAGAMAQGADAAQAATLATAQLYGSVAKQAAVLGFEKAFLFQGVLFLVVLPLLFFLKVNRGPAPKVELHLE